MDSIFEKYAKLKELYPADIETIEADEMRVRELLEGQEYYEHPGTKHLVSMCRDEIKQARLKLATDSRLPIEAIRELWDLIASRTWVIKTVVKDFQGELAQIETDVDGELNRGL